MKTYVILRRGGWSDGKELEIAAGRSSRVGLQEMPDRVRWIRSYALNEPDGRVGTVCVYQGRDEASILEHARRAGLPADEIIQVAETVVINDDPVPARAER
jgi:hypothetical protein